MLKDDVLLTLPQRGDTFIIKCDASQVGLGAALFVRREDDQGKTQELPVAFASRTLAPVEQRYANTDREGLAVVWAVDTFEHYTFGNHFKVIIETDHSPLITLFKKGDLTGRFARYAYALHDHDFELIHKPGKSMAVPDFFSRYQITKAELEAVPPENRHTFGDRAIKDPLSEAPLTNINFEIETTDREVDHQSPLTLEHLFDKVDTPLDDGDGLSSPFEQENFRIVSWNVNGLHALSSKLLKTYRECHEDENLETRADALSKYLIELRCDIACLQETKLGNLKESLWKQLNQLTEWNLYHNEPRTGSNGVITLARKHIPVLSVLEGDLTENTQVLNNTPQKTERGRDLETLGKTGQEGRCVTIQLPGLKIVNLYLPNGTRGEHRQLFKDDFCKSLYDYGQKLKVGTDFVLVFGDFNIVRTLDDAVKPLDPDNDLEKYSTFRPHEREWINRFIELGLIDGFRRTHPTSKSKTWYDPRLRKGILRIDFAFIDERLHSKWRVDHHWTHGFSDHAQVRFELRNMFAKGNSRNDSLIILPGLKEDSIPDNEKQIPSDSRVLGKTINKIAEIQKNDPLFGDVIRQMTGETPLNPENQSRILGLIKTCVIRNGILYFISENPFFDVRRGPVKRALCVPEVLRKRILHLMHDDMMSGHFGSSKSRLTIRDRFWWPSFNEDFTNHLKTCETCNKSKDIPKRIGFLKPVPLGNNPWERVGIDIVGKLQTSRSGNNYIIVLTDYFTRWAEAFAVPSIDAQTVAKTVVEQCFLRMGVPLVLHSDQGQPFVSEFMTRVLQLLGLKQGLSTPYWPQANGLVERTNKTLCQMIRAYINKSMITGMKYCPIFYTHTEMPSTLAQKNHPSL